LAAQPTEVGAKMQVRVNALETPWASDDLAAVPVGVAIRLTNTGAPADVSAA